MKKKKAVKVILWVLAAIFVIAAIGVGGLYYYWKCKVVPRLMPSASPSVAGEVIPETALPENVGEVLIPGVYGAGEISQTDGLAQACALADKLCPTV